LGFLDKLEKGIERVVTGAFSKTFKSELQPIEIAAAIRAHMDANASVVSRDRILVPNKFEIFLSTADFGRLKLIADRLKLELANLANEHAKKQGYQFAGNLSLELKESGQLHVGQVQIMASSPVSEPGEVEWLPMLEVIGDGLQFNLHKQRTKVGRDGTSDIQINDSSLSRQHFELIWDGKRAGIRDLGSTNGTFVGGVRISEQALVSDSNIKAGNKYFNFKIVAKAVSDSE
jgi:hypothetical protein